ncbi:MAG: hypothetical protein ACH350_01600 [Parachlamydiaceae bacterium]
MLNHQNPLSRNSFQHPNFPVYVIAFSVILLHAFLLMLGTYWKPAHREPPKKAKVVVKTIRLKPFQAEITQLSGTTSNPLPVQAPTSAPLMPAPTPIEKLTPPPPTPQLIQEEAPKKELEVKHQQEETRPTEQMATMTEAPSPPPTSPPLIKKDPLPEAKPIAPASSKMPSKEAPKKTAAPAAPIKKTIEPAHKPIKTDAAKQKEAEEAEKKRQQEIAEKKKLQERAEAEKKRQIEIAEIEKKRQQEIALAQEAAREKVAKAKESLAKMNQTRDKMSTLPKINLDNTAIPKELGNLHIDSFPLDADGGTSAWGTKETSYSDEVAYYLKRNLKLPDYGAVKIKLTLDRMGKVKKIEIIKSESNKNKIYLENEIKKMIFSSFDQKFQGVDENTFVITLQND